MIRSIQHSAGIAALATAGGAVTIISIANDKFTVMLIAALAVVVIGCMMKWAVNEIRDVMLETVEDAYDAGKHARRGRLHLLDDKRQA